MKKTKYLAPSTKHSDVELEQGIMKASIDPKNPDNETGRIEEHQVNNDFNFSFADQEWDRQ